MMEKEPQPDSISVTVKEYAPSEVYSNEPPPAYHRPRQATAVQVARIVAYTVVAVSFMLGAFMLASAYITANASCAHLQQELMLLQEAADRFQVPEALIQEEPIAQQSQVSSNQVRGDVAEEKSSTVAKTQKPIVVDDVPNESSVNSVESDEDSSDEEDDEDLGHNKIHIKLPLQLDFDDLAGALMEQNQRSRMNCIVEKKRNDEVIDHQPRSIRLPFGLNLTTDPRYERVTGEKMAIYCESGNEQRHSQPAPQTEDVIMHVQPFMVPLAASAPVPFNQHHASQQPQHPPAIHPQLIAQQIAHVQRIAQQQHQARMQHEQEMQRQHHHQQQAQSAQIIPHFIQEMPIFQHHQPQQQPQPVPHAHMQPPQIQQQQQQPPRIPEALLAHAQRLPIPEELLTQLNRLPNEDVIAIQVTEDDSSESNDNSEAEANAAPETKPDGRQMFARGLPVHIPVPMMQDMQQPAPEEQRPHYLHPRSVRSVNNPLLHREKRVKRCSCDCSC